MELEMLLREEEKLNEQNLKLKNLLFESELKNKEKFIEIYKE